MAHLLDVLWRTDSRRHARGLDPTDHSLLLHTQTDAHGLAPVATWAAHGRQSCIPCYPKAHLQMHWTSY